MGVRVIDVSRWQGRIDWPAVKNSGVQGAWIKVGGADGGKLYTDARAGENMAGAEAAEVPFGTYYFCTPRIGNAREQAQHAVLCGHGRGTLLPAADLESNPHGLTQEQYDQWATEFCAEVHRQIERESVIYTYSGARLVGYTGNAPRHCRLWIANYGRADTPGTTPPNFAPGIPPAWDHWDAWQFNSVTRIPGIADNTVDQNVVTDEFWAAMTTPLEEDDMALTVKCIMWTRPDSKWAEQVAGLPANPDPAIGRIAAWLVYDVAGTVRHITNEDHLRKLWFCKVTDTGFADDWLFEQYQLVGASSAD